MIPWSQPDSYLVTKSCLSETPWTVALQASLSMGFSRQEYWSGLPRPPPGDLPNPWGLPNPWAEPRSPVLQADSLLSYPPGKPKNTGVGSLSLLQGNFLIQESNQGLWHCRRLLYQLSYQGSPTYGCYWGTKPPYSLLPATTTTNILGNLYSRAEVPHLSSACSFEQGSHKLIFGIATISGENNGFGIWSVNCKTLNKLFGEWWYGFIELL